MTVEALPPASVHPAVAPQQLRQHTHMIYVRGPQDKQVLRKKPLLSLPVPHQLFHQSSSFFQSHPPRTGPDFKCQPLVLLLFLSITTLLRKVSLSPLQLLRWSQYLTVHIQLEHNCMTCFNNVLYVGLFLNINPLILNHDHS